MEQSGGAIGPLFKEKALVSRDKNDNTQGMILEGSWDI